MKKILSFIVFLLTLCPILDITDASIVSAQSATYENGSFWLPNLEVSSTNEKCDKCNHYYDPEEEHICTFKCDYCDGSFENLNDHYRNSYSCGNAAGYAYGNSNNNGDSNNNGEGNSSTGNGNCNNNGFYYCPNCGVMVQSDQMCNKCGVVIIAKKNNGNDVWYNVSFNDRNVLHSSADTSENAFVNSTDETSSETDTLTQNCSEATKKALSLLDEFAKKESKSVIKGFSKEKLIESIKRQLLYPHVVQQGTNGTCAVACWQKYLLCSNPEQYTRCIISLFTTGKFPELGLTIPISIYDAQDSDLDNEASANDISAGLPYTSADAIMQAALLTMVQHESLWNSFWNFMRRLAGKSETEGDYNPLKEGADGGGLSLIEISEYVDGADYWDNGATFEVLSQIDYTKYYVYASVAMDTYTPLGRFINGNNQHAVEIIGVQNGKIEYWSWGRVNTSERGPVM